MYRRCRDRRTTHVVVVLFRGRVPRPQSLDLSVVKGVRLVVLFWDRAATVALETTRLVTCQGLAVGAEE